MSEYKDLLEWAKAEPVALRKTVYAINDQGAGLEEPEHYPDVPRHLLPLQVYTGSANHTRRLVSGIRTIAKSS